MKSIEELIDFCLRRAEIDCFTDEQFEIRETYYDIIEQLRKTPCEAVYICKESGHGECHHTKYIQSAKNFKEVSPGKWMEKENRGEFELYRDDDYSGGGYILCTACKFRFSFGAYKILEYDNYCPHCGAKIIRKPDQNGITLTFDVCMIEEERT